jgi:two-component system chemotaxis response regulator CheB
MSKVSVLIVDDSLVARNLLSLIFGTDPDILVVGKVCDGIEALQFLTRQRPDVITMDINMPGMDGFDVTARILQEYAIPIVIVSGNFAPSETAKSFRALEAGAVAILAKPAGPGAPEFSKTVHKFCATIKSMAEVRVVRRKSSTPPGIAGSQIEPISAGGDQPLLPHRPVGIIAIGASAGGPEALVEFFRRMKSHLTVPVLLVQHIDSGFVENFTTWLAERTGIPVIISKNGELPVNGTVYMAPGGCHLAIGHDKLISITDDPPEKGIRPSVAYLFRSALNAFGPQAMAVLFSGMGRDGAEELKLMKDRGCITLVQDEKSSLVFGMPGEACRLGAACHILPPVKIAEMVQNYLTT